MTRNALEFRRLGLVPYARAFEIQQTLFERMIAARDTPDDGVPALGVVLLLEHPPVVTVSRRASAAANVIATPDALAARGVEVAATDRGGDVTYHGPGQLVAYPILDLNALNLGLHAYMRLLEEAVIRVCAAFGVATMRDTSATGVWTAVGDPAHAEGAAVPGGKIAAMGVRVRKWVSMHGLSLNVSPDLAHFGLIVPCGLVGRQVTSLARELPATPTVDQVADQLERELGSLILGAAASAAAARDAARR